LFSLFAGFLLTVPRLAVSAFSQVFVDEILVSQRQDWIQPLVLGMVLTAVLRGILASLRLTYLRNLMLKLSVTMSGQFVWHILRLPVGFYAQRFAGEISSRLSLNDKVAGILSGTLGKTIIDTVMMVFYFLIMLQYDRLLTGIAFVFASINFFALQLMLRTRVDANLKLAQEYGKVNGVAIAGIQTIETLKASGLESDSFAKFAGYYAKALNAQQDLGLQSQVLTILPTLLSALMTASILTVGGLKVMDGTLSVGMLVAYQSLMAGFLAPIDSLINFGSLLQDLEADLNRLDDVLQNSVDPEVERGSEESKGEGGKTFSLHQSPITGLQGYVELQNITFGYSRVEKPLIENFSLSLKPGQRVAVVGTSGSGKSTIAKLIGGLYQPWSGEILFDGTPRKQISRSVLTSSLAMVEQDIFLFGGTVRENLTLWDSTV
ncbi:MAG: ATP-binding cassette domain-containing protein, partial [Microcoleus sp. C1-bin4]|nr:ATP-binding cassette domain-containing protein [Microcoleus sp. C1-bin4]